MSQKYKNLLSPLKVGNLVLKNRLTASPSRPQYIQGPEPYPAEGTITHYANKARNGAALITCNGASPVPLDPNRYFTGTAEDSPWMMSHATDFDIFEGHCQHYMSQLTETIHFYGARALANTRPRVPANYDVSSGVPSEVVEGTGMKARTGQELSEDLLEEIAENYVLQASILKGLGFDGLFLHMAYRFMFLGRFLSPLTNKRTDRYGGTLENRARFPLLVARRIKQKCGKDFIIEASISGCENSPDGLTLEDTIQYAKIFSEHIDMLQVRAGDIDPAHPTGFNRERTPFLHMAEAVKKSGAEILQREQYDAVLAAVGSEPLIPSIPGIDSNMAIPATDVYGNEDRLAEKVVVIGGGEVGVETGMHLAENGRHVTVLEMRNKLAHDSTPLHYYSMFREAWERIDNFHYILQARCSRIESDQVTYVDAKGGEHVVEAGAVVIAAGMKSKHDLALKFYGTGDVFFMIGDCNVVGDIQKTMRSAFSIASMM